MTLIARDEADIVDAQIAFHLNAGVDFVVATDHSSQDGTTEILERYADDGYLQLIHERGEFRETEWRTNMARLAATELQADWVFASDADEFWWPRGPDLKDVLAAIPSRYGVVRAFWRNFMARPDDASFFAERMTVRLAATAPIHDPLSQWRPNAKLIHRASPDIVVGRGNHAVEGDLVPLRGWYPIEVLHFPVRTQAQFERKASLYTISEKVRFHEAHRAAHDALSDRRTAEAYRALWVDDEEVERGLAAGTLVADERLRDALRELAGQQPVPPRGGDAAFFPVPEHGPALRFPRPTVVDDAAYAVDAAVLGEADIVRAQRRLDELDRRVASLERRPWPRLMRGVNRVVTRRRRRGAR